MMNDFNIKKSSILIVDDKKANIDVLVGYLEMQGFTNIKTTTDSRLAIGLYKSFSPDLILLDLMMPNLNGFEIMDQLKELVPADIYLPILVLTADNTFETKQKALSSGAKDFISKPFDLTEVGLRINNLLITKKLQQQSLNQNEILEEKVKERTAQLEKLNSELIEAKNKAEESNKLKTAFLNNVSHEIRTPLNGILGFLNIILQTKSLSIRDRDTYVTFINESSNRLIKTINDIVEMSLIQAGQVVLSIFKTRISDIKEEIEVTFKSKAEEKGLAFYINNNLPENLDYIFTDNTKLNTILFNLISNGIKFTTSGLVELNIKKVDNFVVFSVRDTGVGISGNKQKVIFEMFMQADTSRTRQFEGQGLGIAIAKAYAEMLGGKIWVESEPGLGSIFSFSIPYKSKGIKILIAEDQVISDLLITKGIEDMCDMILHAKNGIEAVEACRNNPDIDLILMDIKMPEMNGYEATKKIRLFNKHVIIIAQTAYALVGDREKVVAAGCNDYITKPIKMALLVEIIHKYII
jgi:signal transduction histidine kinase